MVKKKRSFVCKKKLLFSKFFLKKKLGFLDSLLFTNLTKTSFFFHNAILKKNLNLHLKLNGFSFLERTPISIVEKSFIFFNKNKHFNVNLNFSNLYFLNSASDNSLWRYDYLNDFLLKKKNYIFTTFSSTNNNNYKVFNNYIYLRNKLLFMPFICSLQLYIFNPVLSFIRFNYIIKLNYIVKFMLNIIHMLLNIFLYFYLWIFLKLDIFNVPDYIKLFIFFRKLGTILGTLLGDIFVIQFLYYLKWLFNYLLKVNFINLNSITLGNLNTITSKTNKRIIFNTLLNIRINNSLNITLFDLNKVMFNELFIRIFNKVLNIIRLFVFYISAFSSFWLFYWLNIFIFWRLSITKLTFFYGLDYIWFWYAFTPFIWAIKWPLISTKPLLHLYIALTSYFTLNSLLFFMFDSYFLLLFSLYIFSFICSFIFIKIDFFNIKEVDFFKYNNFKLIIIILLLSLIFLGYFFKLFGTSYIHNCIFSFFWEEFLHTLDFFYLHQLHNFIGLTLFYFFFCLFYENFYLRVWILLFSILFFLTECFDHWYAFYYIKRCLFGISLNADYISYRLPGFEKYFTIIDLQLFLLGGGCIEMYASREQKEAYSVSTLYFRDYFRYWWDVQAIYYESRIPFMGMFPDDWFHIKDIYRKNKEKSPKTDNYLASRIYKDTRQLTHFFKDYKINSVEQVISFLEIRFCYGPYVFNDDIIYWIFKSNIINSVHFLCTYLDAFLFFSDFYIIYLFIYVLCYRMLNKLNLKFFKKYILFLIYIFNIRFTISLFDTSFYFFNISSIQYYIRLKSVYYFILAFIIQFCLFYKSLNFLFTQGHYIWFKGYRYPKGVMAKTRNVLENSDFVWLQFDYFHLNTLYKFCLISPADPNMYKPRFRYYNHHLVWGNYPLPKPFYDQSPWRKFYRRRSDFFLSPGSPEPYSTITREKDFPTWFFKNMLLKLNTLDERLSLLKAFEEFYSCDRTEFTYGIGLFPFTSRLPKMNSMSLKPKCVFTNHNVESYDFRIRQEPEEFKNKLIGHSLCFVPDDYKRYYRKDSDYAFDIHPLAKQLGMRSRILLVRPKNASKYYYFEDNPLLFEYMASFYQILGSKYHNYKTIFLTGFPIVFEHFDRNPYNCYDYTSPGFYSDALFTLYNNTWNFIFSNIMAFRYFCYFECKSRIKSMAYISDYFYVCKRGTFLPKVLYDLIVNSELYLVYGKGYRYWNKRFPDIIYWNSRYINIDFYVDADGNETYSRFIYLPYNHAAYIFVFFVKSIFYFIYRCFDIFLNWFYSNQYLYFELVLYFNSYIKYKFVLLFNLIIFLGVEALWGVDVNSIWSVDSSEVHSGLLVYVDSFKEAIFLSIPLFKLLYLLIIIILIIIILILIMLILLLLINTILNTITFKMHTLNVFNLILLFLITIFSFFQLWTLILYLVYILYFFYSISYIFNYMTLNFINWKNNYFAHKNFRLNYKNFYEQNNYFFNLWKKKKRLFCS